MDSLASGTIACCQIMPQRVPGSLKCLLSRNRRVSIRCWEYPRESRSNAPFREMATARCQEAIATRS
jgi:hypothetical protein